MHTNAERQDSGTSAPSGMLGAVDPCLPGLRERKKVRTREALLDAALDLFERKGFDATTIEEIAAAADVSPRTFFRYFESKLDLVMARHEAAKAELGDLVAARPADEGPLEAMRHALQDELVGRLGDAAAAREFQVMMTTPSLRNRAREHFYEEEAGLAAAFAARLGRDADDLGARIIAGSVASAVWEVVTRWISEGADVDRLTGMLDDAFDLLAGGFEPPVARRPAGRGSRRR